MTLIKERARTMSLANHKIAMAFLLIGVLNSGGVAPAQKGTPKVEGEDAPRLQLKEDVSEKKKQDRHDRDGDTLPHGAVARIGTTRWWHGRTQQECPLRYAPKGGSLACCDGKAVRLLDPASGKELRRIEIPGEQLTSFAFSPNGTTMLTASLQSPLLRLWEVSTGKKLQQIASSKKGTAAIAFAPDEKTFAAATGDGEIRLWDASTWQESRQLAAQQGLITSLVFLPDATTLVSGGRTICWWNIATGREIRRVNKALDHSRVLALSPDGKRLAGVVKAAELHLWNAANGEEVSKTALAQEGEHGVWCLCFSPDSLTLACGNANGRKTRFFAGSNGRELSSWAEETETPWIAFSPDGKRLAQVANSIIRFRDVKTGELVIHPGLPGYAMSVGFSADGKRLLTSCRGGQAGVWEPVTGRELASLKGPPSDFGGVSKMLLAPVFTVDGKKAALVDAKGVLHIWDAATGKSLCRINDPPVGEDQPDFSPDGKFLVVKHEDHIIRVWDALTGKRQCRLPLFEGIRFPHPHVFSPDGRMVATAPSSLESGFIRLCDATTGKEVGKLEWSDRSTPTCIRFTADGKFLVAAHGASGPASEEDVPSTPSVRLWNLATGRQRGQFQVQADDIRSMATSPDGKTLAIADHDVIVLMELANGKERGRFTGHWAWIWSLAFSPNGRLLASGSLDHTALVWDMTGTCPDDKWASHDLPPDDLKRQWTALASADGVQAYRALWKMVAGGPQSVPFLADRLRPVHGADEKRLTRLIADLDSARFEVRNRAFDDLRQFGELAEPALNEALKKKPSLEVRRRLETLLEELERRILSPDELHVLRALEVLEHFNSPEAQKLLQVLAKGAPQARLTREAGASLDRLARRADDHRE
jgi:WD40 repeat protein